MEIQDLKLDVNQAIEIAAPAAAVFEQLIQRLSTDNARPDGVAMPMRLELRPGGRWYRDLGDEAGHLWGLVQVVKPPHLLEIQGPMFMSYPVAGHVQFRITETDGRSTLALRHQAFGLIDPEHREHAVPGWQHLLNMVQQTCQ